MNIKNDISSIENINARTDLNKKVSTDFLSKEIIDSVRAFHRGFSNYQVTPLVSLDALANELGVKKIWVKDESYRFGLNAFKVLGAAFAIGKYISKRLGVDINELSFKKLKTPEFQTRLGDITFTTATDGNHGRAVAWAARELGQKAVIYLPRGTAQSRIDAIKDTGAEAYVMDMNYDEVVRFVAEKANKNGWVIVQDTAWEGYHEIPVWIMQGYATMVDEAQEQLINMGIGEPTHVFLQAGVGAFAGSVVGYYASAYGNDRPFTIIVEPDKAACIFKSVKAKDGNPHAVTGDLNTIMAGLACGEPNPISWEILRDYADMYFSCPDYVAAKGMRVLANPLGYDKRIISGESGSVGIGLLTLLLGDKRYKKLLSKLNINEDSKVLIFNTEGATDPVGYRKIVWDGKYPVPERDD